MARQSTTHPPCRPLSLEEPANRIHPPPYDDIAPYGGVWRTHETALARTTLRHLLFDRHLGCPS
jgi:hypothetical protein